MSSKTLCNLIRFAVLATAACAFFIALIVLPSWGKSIVIALALLAAVLSHYITKAAELQEFSKGMI